MRGRDAATVLVDSHSGKVPEAAILGIEEGGIMAVLQLAVMGNLRYHSLRVARFAHQTLAESLNNLFAAPEEV